MPSPWSRSHSSSPVPSKDNLSNRRQRRNPLFFPGPSRERRTVRAFRHRNQTISTAGTESFASGTGILIQDIHQARFAPLSPSPPDAMHGISWPINRTSSEFGDTAGGGRSPDTKTEPIQTPFRPVPIDLHTIVADNQLTCAWRPGICRCRGIVRPTVTGILPMRGTPDRIDWAPLV